MAESSWPSPDNSHAVTDIQYEQLVTPAAHGLIGSPSDTPAVYADSSGKQVKIRPGKAAWLRGHRWASDPSVDIIQALASNTSGNTRIDRIVLRYSRTTYNVNLAVLQGTPSGSPVVPALTQQTGTTGVFEIPLARVTLANNYSTVAAGNVTPEAWYLGTGGLILCTSSTRPSGVDSPQLIYETDTGAYARWNGSKWMRDPVRVKATHTDFLNTTSPAPVTGMSIALDANSTYEWDLCAVTFGAQNVGCLLWLQIPSGATLDAQVSGWTDSNGTQFVANVNAATGNAQLGSNGWGYNASVNRTTTTARGILTVGSTAGNAVLLGAQRVATGSGASYVDTGSWMELRQVA